MPRIHRHALVMHSSKSMFNLVNDVKHYADFLPWCERSKVLEESEEEMLARLVVAKGKLRQAFITRNQLNPNESIEMSLEEGPFRTFKGVWEFQSLNEHACKISLDLEFDFSGRLAAMAFGRVFSDAANSMVDAFCNRANELYR